MCTSTASKPARSNAAAISTWPLTPCSRRIATRGRAPRRDERRRDVLGRVEGELRRAGPGSSRVGQRCAFLVARIAGRRAARCMPEAGLRPGAPQLGARLASSKVAPSRLDHDTARPRRGAADRMRVRAEPVPLEQRRDTRRRSRRAPARPRRVPRRTARATGSRVDRRRRGRPRGRSAAANAISASVTNRPPSERSW